MQVATVQGKTSRRLQATAVVDKVELLEANYSFAHVRFPNGKKFTASVNDLALRSIQIINEDGAILMATYTKPRFQISFSSLFNLNPLSNPTAKAARRNT